MTFSPADRPEIGDFADRLLCWYRRRGRQLPWRCGHDPYRIWISEIMLQQTGVGTVIPYYQRFLARFPDLASLASASIDEVIALWAGLGYYSRARNLHAAAQILVADHGGRFPEELPELTRLPGIGRSTAGAIRTIAFGKRAPILDGNVRRILSRIFALEAPLKTAKSQKQLWAWAEQLTPDDNVDDYSQAIMDLGATVCTPRNPDCAACPVSPCCVAFRLGKTAELPLSVVKKTTSTVQQVALVLNKGGRFLLQKRPYQGFLGGLWEFPSASLKEAEESGGAAQGLLDQLGLDLRGQLRRHGKIRHAYSHFRLIAEVFCGEVFPRGDRIGEQDREEQWFSRDAVASLPLHGAHRKIMEKLEKEGKGATFQK